MTSPRDIATCTLLQCAERIPSVVPVSGAYAENLSTQAVDLNRVHRILVLSAIRRGTRVFLCKLWIAGIVLAGCSRGVVAPYVGSPAVAPQLDYHRVRVSPRRLVFSAPHAKGADVTVYGYGSDYVFSNGCYAFASLRYLRQRGMRTYYRVRPVARGKCVIAFGFGFDTHNALYIRVK